MAPVLYFASLFWLFLDNPKYFVKQNIADCPTIGPDSPKEGNRLSSMDRKPGILNTDRESMDIFCPEDGLESVNTDRFEDLLAGGETAKLPGYEDMKIAIEEFDISALEENLLSQ